MAGNQFVLHRGAGEVHVVAAHGLQLRVVRHGVGRVGNGDDFAAGEERGEQLPLRRHHLHPPGFPAQRRHGDQIVLDYVIGRFLSQVADQSRLLAWLDVQRLDFLDGFLPIVAKTHGARGLLHLGLAPGILFLGQVDDLLRGVRDQLAGQLSNECLAADGPAVDAAVVRRLRRGFAAQKRGVGAEGLVDRLGLLGRELRILGPLFQHQPQFDDRSHRSRGRSGAALLRRLARLLDLFR